LHNFFVIQVGLNAYSFSVTSVHVDLSHLPGFGVFLTTCFSILMSFKKCQRYSGQESGLVIGKKKSLDQEALASWCTIRRACVFFQESCRLKPPSSAATGALERPEAGRLAGGLTVAVPDGS